MLESLLLDRIEKLAKESETLRLERDRLLASNKSLEHNLLTCASMYHQVDSAHTQLVTRTRELERKLSRKRGK